jgi:hypothetical protein
VIFFIAIGVGLGRQDLPFDNEAVSAIKDIGIIFVKWKFWIYLHFIPENLNFSISALMMYDIINIFRNQDFFIIL